MSSRRVSDAERRGDRLAQGARRASEALEGRKLPRVERAPAKIAGACLCGAVRFEVTGPPDRVVHCHCTICQRAHGAAFVTWAALPNERVRVTAGRLSAVPVDPQSDRDLSVFAGDAIPAALDLADFENRTLTLEYTDPRSATPSSPS